MEKAFVIRDDDTCFHTDPEELTDAFGALWALEAKVSLSVIPFTDGKFGDVSIGKYRNGPKRYFYENLSLINFLNRYIDMGLIEPVIHGFDHEYIQKDGKWISELRWKSPSQVKNNLKESQKLFSEYFGCEVNTFVPPSNGITKDVSVVLDMLGVNASSVIELNFNRRIDAYSLYNYLLKIYYRLFTGRTVPIVLRYRRHKELAYYNLTPSANVDNIYKSLQYCNKKGLPFVLSTHYWELNENSYLKREMENIYNFAMRFGYQSRFLSSVLK